LLAVVGGCIVVAAGRGALRVVAQGRVRLGECHVHGFFKSEVAAMGDTGVELVGELMAEGHDLVLLVAQLLLEHGNLGRGLYLWAPWWRVGAFEPEIGSFQDQIRLI
jgi:hypothetical protein